MSKSKHFSVTFKERTGTNVEYTINKTQYRFTILNREPTDLVNKPGAGQGYARANFTRYKQGKRGKIDFIGVEARNDSGQSRLDWRVDFPAEGNIRGGKLGFDFIAPKESSVPAGYALLSAGDGDELDDDPDDEFDDGGDENEGGSMDEDGDITAVIGSTSGEYV